MEFRFPYLLREVEDIPTFPSVFRQVVLAYSASKQGTGEHCMLKGTQAYVQTKFTTVGQGEILIMLYDGAIKFLTLAKEKIEAKDYAAKGMLLSRTLDIIHELDSALNMEAGGEIAENLHKLYFMCCTRLLQANLRMDVTFIDSVIKILSGLRSAYAEILNRPEVQAAAAKLERRAPTSSSMQKAAIPTTHVAPTGAARAVVRSAYGQQASLSVQEPAAPSPSLSIGETPPPTKISAPLPKVADFAPVMKEAQEQLPPQAPPAAVPVQPAPPVAPPVTIPDVPEQPIPPVNMLNRRLAATNRYGKIAQNM